MDDFVVTESAQDDLEEIYSYILRRDGAVRADYVVNTLYAAFDDLARLPAIGHKRADIAEQGLLFHTVFRFEIVFSRDPHIIIRRIIHGSRDVPRRI